MHCYMNCNCTQGETDKSVTQNVWRFVDGHQLTLRENGQVDLESTTSSGGAETASMGQSGSGSGSGGSSGSDEPDPKRIKLTVLPAECNDVNVTAVSANVTAGEEPSSSASAGAANDVLRPQAWPTSLLGPVPSAPPNATEVVKPGSAGSGTKGGGKPSDMTVCGNKCEGVADCGSGNGTDHVCTCAYPNANDAKWLGLDPVMPMSVCLVLMNVAFGVGKMKGGGDLNGRDVGNGGVGQKYLDGEGAEWLCRCNATFAHNECCGSQNGMVWLD